MFILLLTLTPLKGRGLLIIMKYMFSFIFAPLSPEEGVGVRLVCMLQVK